MKRETSFTDSIYFPQVGVYRGKIIIIVMIYNVISLTSFFLYCDEFLILDSGPTTENGADCKSLEPSVLQKQQ